MAHTALLLVLPERDCVEEDIQIPHFLMKKGLAVVPECPGSIPMSAVLYVPFSTR